MFVVAPSLICSTLLFSCYIQGFLTASAVLLGSQLGDSALNVGHNSYSYTLSELTLTLAVTLSLT